MQLKSASKVRWSNVIHCDQNHVCPVLPVLLLLLPSPSHLGWQPVWQVVGASYRPLMCFPSPHPCSLQWHRAPSSWTWRAYGHSDGIGFPWLGPMRWHSTVFTLDSSPRTQLPHRECYLFSCGRPLSRLQLQPPSGLLWSPHTRHSRTSVPAQPLSPHRLMAYTRG